MINLLDASLFFAGKEAEFSLFLSLHELIVRGRESAVQVQKTQISYTALPQQVKRLKFAWVWLPPQSAYKKQHALLLTLGLPSPLQHPLLFGAVEPYPGRFTHHFAIPDAAALDDSLDALVQASYDFACNRPRRNAR